LDLHYLKIFYEVAKEGSFTKAAQNLFINQSAVSIQVKKFEEILGTKLFDRSSKKIKLTYPGKVLFKMSEEIFQKVKRVEKEMTRIVEFNRAKIIIGATHIAGEPIIPRLMKGFSKLHPEIEYDIRIKEKEEVLKMLREGEIDVALIDQTMITDNNIEIIDIEEVSLVLVSSSEYRDIEEVSQAPLIIRDNIAKHNEAVTAFENKHEIEFQKKISAIGSLATIKGMVKEGLGNAVLPYYAVYEHLEKGEFKLIEIIDGVTDGYQLAVTKDKKSLLEIIKFVNFAKNFKV